MGARPLEVEAAQLPSTPTLAERFAEAGFLCVGFASRTTGPLPAEWTRGFHQFEQGSSDQKTLAPAITFASGHDWGSGRGVFMWLHLSSPAPPFSPKSFAQAYLHSEVDYATLFTDPNYQGPLKALALPGAEQVGAEGLSGELSPADRQFLTGLYDGEVAYSAYMLWYALDLVRYFTQTEDSLKDTAFCVAGSVGISLEAKRIEDLAWGGVSDAALAVPLLLSHPPSMTGRRILKALVTLEDLGPTMIDWFGLEGREDWRGRSLLGVTDRRPNETFRPGPSCSYDPRSGQLTARDWQWRLTVSRSSLGRKGEAMPADAQLTPVESLRYLPKGPSPQVTQDLLEALRAWAWDQPKAKR